MKQSELLRKQADMMDMAEKHGIDDWLCLMRLKMMRHDAVTGFYNPEYNYALGVVEGRPVFEGDELYFKGIKRIATAGSKIQFPDNFDASGWTWNPPKPRTILVELLVEDAEGTECWYNDGVQGRVKIACRKALEAIK